MIKGTFIKIIGSLLILALIIPLIFFAIESIGNYIDNVDPDIAEIEIDEFIIMGDEFALREQYDLAAKSYNQALKLDNSMADVWHYMGISYWRMGKLYKAVKCYDSAIFYKPDYYDAYLCKIDIFIYDFERLEAAKRLCDQVIEMNNDNDFAWFFKGMANYKLRNYDASVRFYDSALKYNDCFVEAWNNKGVSLNELERYEDALTCFNESLECDPTGYDSYFGKADAYYELKKYHKALQCINNFLEYESYNKEAIEFKTQILSEM